MQHVSAFTHHPIIRNTVLALLLVVSIQVVLALTVGIAASGTTGGILIVALPGWFIGLVWTGFFLAFGLVTGVAESDGSPQALKAKQAIFWLAGACAVYPLYTFGLRNNIMGLIGNVATIALAVWASLRVAKFRLVATAAPLAVLAWLLFASAAILDQN